MSCRDGSIKDIMCCQKMIINGVMGETGFVIIGLSPEGHQKKTEFSYMIHHRISPNTP